MKPLPFLNPAAGTPAVRNPGRPAVIVPTQAVTAEELSADSDAAAATNVVDVVEWRIDPLLAAVMKASSSGDEATSAEEVLHLLPHATSSGLPVLLTVRTAFEGGLVEIPETDYAAVIRGLIIGLGAGAGGVPVALDVEIDRTQSRSLIAEARAQGVPVVASHHNFAATDSLETLRGIYRTMDETGADVAKVAMMPQTPADVARLLEATAEAAAALRSPVLGIAMGSLGRASRIMGADFGTCATFAQVGRASAPGQIDALRLAEILDRLGA